MADTYLKMGAKHTDQANAYYEAKDYVKAFKSYETGVQLLLAGARLEKNESRQARIRKDAATYLERAESLKKLLAVGAGDAAGTETLSGAAAFMRAQQAYGTGARHPRRPTYVAPRAPDGSIQQGTKTSRAGSIDVTDVTPAAPTQAMGPNPSVLYHFYVEWDENGLTRHGVKEVRGYDWKENYSKLIAFVKKKVGKLSGNNEIYLVLNNIIISNYQSLVHAIQTIDGWQDMNPIVVKNVVVKTGQAGMTTPGAQGLAPKVREVQCIILYQGDASEPKKFIFPCVPGKTEYSRRFRDLKLFVAGNFGINPQNFDKVCIYYIEDEKLLSNLKNLKLDRTAGVREIKLDREFAMLFEQNTDRIKFHFNFTYPVGKTEISKDYDVVIDVSESSEDCKEQLKFTVARQSIRNQEAWLESYQSTLNAIGDKLKNSKWFDTNDLLIQEPIIDAQTRERMRKEKLEKERIEREAREKQEQAESQPVEVKSGFLLKLGEGLVRTWKRRYFVLHSNGTIEYYTERDEFKGSLNVMDAEAIRQDTKQPKRFCVETKERKWEFESILDDVNAKEWIEAIVTTIKNIKEIKEDAAVKSAKTEKEEKTETQEVVRKTRIRRIERLEQFIAVFYNFDVRQADKSNIDNDLVYFYVKAKIVPDKDSKVALSEKMFIINYDGNALSWKPGLEKRMHRDYYWMTLSQTVESRFKSIQLSQMKITYDTSEQTENNIDVSKIAQQGNELTQENIADFLDLLRESKDARVMYFVLNQVEQEVPQKDESPQPPAPPQPLKEYNSLETKMVLQEVAKIEASFVAFAASSGNFESDLEQMYDHIRDRHQCTQYLKEKKSSAAAVAASQAFKDAFMKRMQLVRDAMSSEGYSDENSIMKALKKGLDEGFSQDVAKCDWKLVYDQLQLVINEIRPFDIKYMLQLYQKTEDSGRKVSGKDVLLILGHTGSGKSTTIHYLCGSEMSKNDDTGHIEPMNVTNDELKEIRTEWTVAQSVTRYVGTVGIKLSENGIVPKASERKPKNLVFLMDTPGFDDTSGPEVDTANGLGVVRALKDANSVRILLLVSRGDIDTRARGLSALSHTLAKICPNFDKYLEQKCVCIFFTKMAGTTETQLSKNIAKAIEEVGSKANKDVCFLKMLEHVDDLDDLIFVDPCDAEARQSTLKALFGRGGSKGWISRPGNQFQPFVTTPSHERIQQQILRHKESIVKSLRQDATKSAKSQYEVMGRKLNELKQLYRVLPEQNVLDVIDACVNTIATHWNQRCNDLMAAVSEPDSSLKEFENALIKYKNLLDECQSFDTLVAKHLKSAQDSKQAADCDLVQPSRLLTTLTKVFVENVLNNCTLSPDSAQYLERAESVLTVFEAENSPKELDFVKYFNQRMHELAREVRHIESETRNMIASIVNVDNADTSAASESDYYSNLLRYSRRGTSMIGGKIAPYSTRDIDAAINRSEASSDAPDDIDNDVMDVDNVFDPICAQLAILSNATHLRVSPSKTRTTRTTTKTPTPTPTATGSNTHTHTNTNSGASAFKLDLETIESDLVGELRRQLAQVKSDVTNAFAFQPGVLDIKTKRAISHNSRRLDLLCNAQKAFSVPHQGMDRSLGDDIASYVSECESAIVEYLRSSSSLVVGLLRKDESNISSQYRQDRGSVSSMGSAHTLDASPVGQAELRRQARQFMEQMDKIRKLNQNVQLRTGDCYYQTIENIVGYMHNVQRAFYKMIDQVMGQVTDHIDYGELYKCITILREFDWVFDLKDGRVGDEREREQTNEVIEMVAKKLEQYIDTLLDDATGLYIDLDTKDTVAKAKGIVASLQELKKLQKLLPNSMASIDDVAAEIEKQFRSKLKYIIEKFGDVAEEDGQDVVVADDGKESQADAEPVEKKVEEKDELDKIRFLNTKDANNALNFIQDCKKIKWIPNLNPSAAVVVEEGLAPASPTAAGAPVAPQDESVVEVDPIFTMPMNAAIKQAEMCLINDLLSYGNYVTNLMTQAFDYLSDIQSDQAGMDAIRQGNTLSTRLRELVNLQQNDAYNRHLFRLLTADGESILAPWSQKLNDLFADIDDILNNLRNGNDARLQVGVEHVKALARVDWFMGRNNGASTKFRELHLKYQTNVNANTGEIMDKIDAEDFTEVQKKFEDLIDQVKIAKSTHSHNALPLERALANSKSYLGRKLVNTSENARLEAIKMSNAADKDCSDLKRMFRNLKDAKTLCKKYIKEDDWEKICRNELSAKQFVKKIVRTMTNRAEAAISSNNFGRAEEEIKKIQTIRDVLGTTLFDDESENVDAGAKDSESQPEVKESSPVKASASVNIESKLDERIHEIRDLFINQIKLKDKRDYSPYNRHDTSPKQLYKKLATVSDDHPKYRQLWQDIEDDILSKFTTEMAETQKYSNYEDSMRAVAFLERVMRDLPEDVVRRLQHQFDDFKNKISSKQANEEIDVCVKDGQYVRLRQSFNSYNEHQQFENANNIKDAIRGKLKKLESSVNEELAKTRINECNLDIIFISFAQVYKIFSEFATESGEVKIQEFRLIFERVRDAIEKKFESVIKEIIKVLRVSSNIKAELVQFNTCLKFASSFMTKIRDDYGDHLSFTERIANNVQALIGTVEQVFGTFTQLFGQYLEQLDIKQLQIVLNTMQTFSKDYTPFWECLKEMDEKFDVKRIKTIMLYEDMVAKLQDTLDNVRYDLKSYNFNKNERTKYDLPRKQFYEEIAHSLSILKECYLVKSHMPQVTDFMKEYYDPCLDNIVSNIRTIDNRISSLLDPNQYLGASDAKDASDGFGDPDTLDEIQNNFSNLKSIEESSILNELSNKECENIRTKINTTQQKIVLKLKSIQMKGLENVNNTDLFVKYLVELEMARTILTHFSEKAQRGIDECLNKYARERGGAIPQLATRLDQVPAGWGSHITSQNGLFKGYNISIFNNLTNAQNISYVAELISCNDKSIEKQQAGDKMIAMQIKKDYEEYESFYKKLVDENLRRIKEDGELILDPLVDNIEQIARDGREAIMEKNGDNNFRKGQWNSNVKESAIELMASIFAIWTLQNSQYYFEASGKVGDEKSYLKQPRAAQVVSILRLLSIDDPGSELERHLVEIGTGEGKSLTLAVAACILALLGFDVSCACYSEYLSKRDYIAFENLFDLLRIKDYIHYGTFNQLCERVINGHGNVRQLVEDAVLSKKLPNDEAKSCADRPDVERDEKAEMDSMLDDGELERRKVLLIDEADIFFNSDFYGNTYTPGAIVRDGSIKEVTDFIWSDYKKFGKNSKLTFGDMQKTRCYKNVEAKFGKFWIGLIDEAIKAMLSDVKDFDTTNYEVSNGKIGYKMGDMIDTKAKIGYKTMFTYYKEKEAGNVNENDWMDCIAIYLKCGSFSFAEIPGQFEVILGVTGTLKSLSRVELNIMTEQYGIRRHTYMPSLFGDRRQRFTFKKLRDISLNDNDSYYENLKEEILHRMNENASPRCVFVCFSNKLALQNFYNSGQYVGALRHNTLMMTEDLSKDEKNSIVKRAPLSGRVLFMTKEFGRGTDFQVSDKIVKSNGGPHVIQTFLSLQRSEEIQIMGRTARQGGKGSYSMVLNTKELIDEFQLTKEDIDKARDADTVYKLLNDARENKFEKQYSENTRFVTEAKKQHENAMQLLDSLQNGSQEDVKRRLIALNLGPAMSLGIKNSKIVILMDATGSMGNLLQQAKNTVTTMFDRVSLILKESKMDTKCFQVQFIAYRSYNAPVSLLLERSGWSSDAIELRNFLSNVHASYGIWEEAIEVALQHVNRLVRENGDDIRNVLLLGDAPPTPKIEDVMSWRIQYKPEKFTWNNYKEFDTATHYKEEIAKFKESGIVLNTYYLDQWAKASFEWMANETGGKCEFLDVNKKESANMLTHIVAKTVLSACDVAGGKGNGELEKKYINKFMHV